MAEGHRARAAERGRYEEELRQCERAMDYEGAHALQQAWQEGRWGMGPNHHEKSLTELVEEQGLMQRSFDFKAAAALGNLIRRRQVAAGETRTLETLMDPTAPMPCKVNVSQVQVLSISAMGTVPAMNRKGKGKDKGNTKGKGKEKGKEKGKATGYQEREHVRVMYVGQSGVVFSIIGFGHDAGLFPTVTPCGSVNFSS